MDELMLILPTARVYTHQEWARIRQGLRPQRMEHHWSARVVGDRLFLHRSWTSELVYQADFVQVERGWQISAAWTGWLPHGPLHLHGLYLELLMSLMTGTEANRGVRARFEAAGGHNGLARGRSGR